MTLAAFGDNYQASTTAAQTCTGYELGGVCYTTTQALAAGGVLLGSAVLLVAIWVYRPRRPRP